MGLVRLSNSQVSVAILCLHLLTSVIGHSPTHTHTNCTVPGEISTISSVSCLNTPLFFSTPALSLLFCIVEVRAYWRPFLGVMTVFRTVQASHVSTAHYTLVSRDYHVITTC